MPLDRFALPLDQIAEFSRRWQVREFALFGSAVRDDFGPDARRTLFDLVDMRDELQTIFGRPVDILTRGSVEASTNRFRREAILSSAEVVHVR